MTTTRSWLRPIAFGVLLCAACTHYADIKGDNPKARAWADEERKREQQERERTRTEQARSPAAIPDPDHAALPPPRP
jgi:hypothetical protein